MANKQLELWPGHFDWAARMGSMGFSTEVQVLPLGRVGIKCTLTPPDKNKGVVVEHSVRTPEGNFKLLLP